MYSVNAENMTIQTLPVRLSMDEKQRQRLIAQLSLRIAANRSKISCHSFSTRSISTCDRGVMLSLSSVNLNLSGVAIPDHDTLDLCPIPCHNYSRVVHRASCTWCGLSFPIVGFSKKSFGSRLKDTAGCCTKPKVSSIQGYKEPRVKDLGQVGQL